MRYERKFRINPKDWEKLLQFIQTKNVPANVEGETQPYKAAGIAGTIPAPTGLATITFETTDPQLSKEFDDLIFKAGKETSRQIVFSPAVSSPVIVLGKKFAVNITATVPD